MLPLNDEEKRVMKYLIQPREEKTKFLYVSKGFKECSGSFAKVLSALLENPEVKGIEYNFHLHKIRIQKNNVEIEFVRPVKEEIMPRWDVLLNDPEVDPKIIEAIKGGKE